MARTRKSSNVENTSSAVIESPVTKTKTSEEPNHCQCGCGGVSLTARFKPGHDATLKARLLREAREGSAKAVAELERLGWSKFLVETKAMRRKAERAAKAAQAEQAAATA